MSYFLSFGPFEPEEPEDDGLADELYEAVEEDGPIYGARARCMACGDVGLYFRPIWRSGIGNGRAIYMVDGCRCVECGKNAIREVLSDLGPPGQVE